MTSDTRRQDDTGALGRVIIKPVSTAWINDDNIENQWRELNYTRRPKLTAAAREYQSFASILEHAGATLYPLPAAAATGLDSLYPRDAAVMCSAGAILCAMGKPARCGEPAELQSAFSALGVPIHGAIGSDGCLEGGDVVWLAPRIVAVGLGYRTNRAGIDQLTKLLDGMVDEVIVVPLPHWRGRDDVFHLMSMISPLDRDLALVYSPLLPVPFRQRLQQLGMDLLEVPDEEFATQACNVLALAPRKALMVDGNPVTKDRLRRAGVEVLCYSGNEISLKGGGGPTCLTRPIERN
ncbi:MAG: hypothetical protein HKN06_06120 [Gammaproteobacteria bacterium]|nr:hypothetical protein [Gammaproteobacteria bacterium]